MNRLNTMMVKLSKKAAVMLLLLVATTTFSLFPTARAVLVAADEAPASSNVFHIVSSHQDGPEATSSSLLNSMAEAETKASCSEKCGELRRGRLRCNLICNCQIKCSKKNPRGNKGFRQRKRLCRRRCRRKADAKIERRKQKRRERREAEAAEAAAELAALDETTRIDMVSVRGVASSAGVFRSSATDPIPYSLPIFDPTQAVSTYGLCAELERDVQAAIAYVANRIIGQCDEYGYITLDREPLLAFAEDAGVAEGDVATREEVTEDSFETNTQEENVDEDDSVKTDGRKYLHIAYGHEIVTSNATTGETLARTSVKPRISNEIDMARYSTRGQVQGLLLHDCILSAIVTGYTYRYLYCDDGVGDEVVPPILSDFGSTSLKLYDTCNNVPTDGNSSLSLLASHDLRGRFIDSRSINGTVHVVTQSSLNLWYHLEEHLQKWNKKYSGMNCSEYAEVAANDSISLIRNTHHSW